jgi:hypothetical protein
MSQGGKMLAMKETSQCVRNPELTTKLPADSIQKLKGSSLDKETFALTATPPNAQSQAMQAMNLAL